MGAYAGIPAQIREAGPGRAADLPFSLVAVTGADAVDFVQRLCSQDVKAQAPGTCSPVAFLNPKGKLVVAGLALRTGDGVLLEVERSLAGKLAQLLEQFHFAEQLRIESREGLQCSALMGGREVFDLAGVPAGTCVSDSSGVSCAVERHGMCWVHRHGEPGSSAPWSEVGHAWSEEQVEAFRICAGLLRMGVDADEGTLALEAALDDHVSLDKGCYTGQEIVARIHTYGHVNRMLCLLSGDSEAGLSAGAELVDAGGATVGRTTSVAPVDGGVHVALGYLQRELATGGTSLRTRTGSAVTVVGW